MKESYIGKSPNLETMELIDKINEILETYGIAMTVRQLYYQCVSADILPNTTSSYRKVVRVVKDGRMLGLIDWDYIEDRLRRPRIPPSWNSIREIIESAKAQFKLDRWAGQDIYCEVWLEKDALSGIVSSATNRWRVPLQVNRGYSSITAMRDAANRFIEAREDNLMDPIIGYLGDHDPSGEDMVRDVRDRLSTFGADVEVVKLAILNEDISLYNLPPQPVKSTDSRADAFRMAHGGDCVELDALRPDVLRQRVEDFILEHLDRDMYDERVEEEDRQRGLVEINFSG